MKQRWDLGVQTVVVTLAVFAMAAERSRVVAILFVALALVVVSSRVFGATSEERKAVEEAMGVEYRLRQLVPLFAPGLAFTLIAAIAGGLILRSSAGRDLPPDLGGDLAGFFGTSGQVIAALLIALGIEGRLFDSADWRFRTARAHGYLVVTLGLASSVVGLVPTMASWIYAACAILAGASVASVVVLLVIAVFEFPAAAKALSETVVVPESA